VRREDKATTVPTITNMSGPYEHLIALDQLAYDHLVNFAPQSRYSSGLEHVLWELIVGRVCRAAGFASPTMRSDDAHALTPAVDQYQFVFFRLKIINKQGERPE
jgi:hypothetical protein